MPPVRRCVFGCLTNGITLHNFPNPRKFPEQFQKWIELVGEPVEDLTPDEIFGKKKVCDLHFTIDDRNRNNRLNAIATPVPFPYQKRVKNRRQANRVSTLNDQYVGIRHFRIVEPINTSNMQLCIPELMMETTTRLSEESMDSGILAAAAPNPMADPEQANIAGNAGAASPREEAHFIAVPFAKNYSWQKPSEVINEDDTTPDAMSMYYDEDATGALQVTTKRKADVGKHLGFTCNVCHQAISGFRYTCVQCSDMDLCGVCEADKAHGDHYMLRIPTPKPAAEIYAVLSSIRRQLMTLEPLIESNKDVENDNIMRFMSEIKSDSGGVEGMTTIDKDADKPGKKADEFDKKADEVGKKADVGGKKEDVVGKKADVVGKMADEFDKKADEVGKKADVGGKKADVFGKKADVVGKKADEFDKKADEVGKKADVRGKKADVVGKKADVVGKKADEFDKKADEVGKKADMGDKKADVVGKQADGVVKEADVVGKKADVVGKKADVVGKKADVADKKVDVFVKETDVVGEKADVIGKEADLPAPDKKQQQEAPVTTKLNAKTTELGDSNPLGAKKHREASSGPKAKRAKTDQAQDAVPSTSNAPTYDNNGRENKQQEEMSSDDNEIKMVTFEAQMELPQARTRWGAEEVVIHDRRMPVRNNPYVARPLRMAASRRAMRQRGGVQLDAGGGGGGGGASVVSPTVGNRRGRLRFVLRLPTSVLHRVAQARA